MLAIVAILGGPAWAGPQDPTGTDARRRERIAQAQRQEGQAVLAIADAAMAGKPVPADFELRWHNDFLKAQQGTFVPFTITIDASKLGAPAALVYVRAAPHTSDGAPPLRGPKRERRGRDDAAEITYPVDAIFPVELEDRSGQVARISRGFSVAPGEYDVFVVVRERVELEAPRPAARAAVLRQTLTVPDFWSAGLTTSTVILADGLKMRPEPIGSDELPEHPYVIGQNDITPAVDVIFRRDEELIVVFLVYNPTVTLEKKFDIQVEYHFFRKVPQGGKKNAAGAAAAHPPELHGEQYFNHTDPQRFNPAIMGAQFDPNAGHPVMAGQGVPLAGFDPGDYRLAIKITDLMSGTSIQRDVAFTVGS